MGGRGGDGVTDRYDFQGGKQTTQSASRKSKKLAAFPYENCRSRTLSQEIKEYDLLPHKAIPTQWETPCSSIET